MPAEGEFLSMQEIQRAADYIHSKRKISPEIGMILGSGLGALAEGVQGALSIPAGDIPGWPVPTVEGHRGLIVLGELEGKSVLLMQGRPHYYEGHSISHIGLPVRVMRLLGATTLVVTNAAGAVNPEYAPGDLMMLRDHINLLGMSGVSPLRGPNLESFGPRFPDMSQAYDREIQKIALQVAEKEGLTLHHGVYVCLAGPSFETPADLRFLRGIGVDAVGMSTVPEVTVARHSGLRVLGISGISNKANLDGETVTSHEEVLEAGKVIGPRLLRLVRGVVRSL